MREQRTEAQVKKKTNKKKTKEETTTSYPKNIHLSNLFVYYTLEDSQF